ncbi:MAG: hypothetical protein ACLR79_14370 [Waltera sp.]
MNRKKIDVYDNLTEIVKELKEGVLLTAKADDQVNSMTISWGMLGIEWGRPVFVTFLREHRFTKELIDKNGEFTVKFLIQDAKDPEFLRTKPDDVKSGAGADLETKISVP